MVADTYTAIVHLHLTVKAKKNRTLNTSTFLVHTDTCTERIRQIQDKTF